MSSTQEENLNALYMAIGYIVINWALIEQAMDGIVTTIYYNANGGALESERPLAFGRKYKFLKKAFNRIPALAGFKDAGLEIVERMNNLSTKRHNLVHGVIGSLQHQNGVYTFSIFNKDFSAGLFRTADIDLKQFPKLAESLTGLCRDSLALAHQIVDRFPRS